MFASALVLACPIVFSIRSVAHRASEEIQRQSTRQVSGARPRSGMDFAVLKPRTITGDGAVKARRWNGLLTVLSGIRIGAAAMYFPDSGRGCVNNQLASNT
jgi:hypothetical protein